jgi:hypothetical protein
MLNYGILISILINMITAKFLGYDPAVNGICVKKYAFSTTPIDDIRKVCIKVNLIDNSYVFVLRPSKFSIVEYIGSGPVDFCGLVGKDYICKIPGATLNVEITQHGRELAMIIQFIINSEPVISFWLVYDFELSPYDPNVKKFEEYMKWLMN